MTRSASSPPVMPACCLLQLAEDWQDAGFKRWHAGPSIGFWTDRLPAMLEVGSTPPMLDVSRRRGSRSASA